MQFVTTAASSPPRPFFAPALLPAAILAYLALTLAIGFYVARWINTSQDFTLAGRQLPSVLVGVTVFATWFGPEMIMGVPGMFVRDGTLGIVTDVFGVFLCMILIAAFYARPLYRRGIVTLGDFFAERFSGSVDLVTSAIQVFTTCFWIAAQFTALALVFQAVLGLTLLQGVVFGALVVVVYTYVGGMWAVSVTDLLQSGIIIGGLFYLLYTVLGEAGGLGEVLSQKPATFYSARPEPGWYGHLDYLAMLLAFGIGGIPSQDVYQRIFSARSEGAGYRGLLLSAVLLTVIGCVPLLIGLAASQVYPELLNDDADGQRLLVDMVLQHSALPLQMLFFGALVSAILSTSSGAMLSAATVVGENLVKPYFPNLTDRRLLYFTRLSTISVALVSASIAVQEANIHALVVASTVMLLVCLFVPLTAGLYWRRANVTGAWCSIAAGGGVWLICNALGTRVDPSIFGLLASGVGMVVGSLVGGRKPAYASAPARR